ncbi:extracellular solute-binding protein [Streptomyces durbertensis]|uniref:Extracellular solute-binding protein n=1 Tax=Streptomyces durbertensis TaxID=2448886 RepID=A0ABR6EE90_9ACTN|nr:extracellular solute-binding protein [Streptomyces durbertensis]MBB1243392.1 extracellular solute-binding protein [Streptomyces durbertensis]
MSRPARRSTRLALATAVALLLGTTACGTDTANGERTVEVWLMQHSVKPELVQRVVDEFEQQHAGVKVRVVEQKWDGIGEKVTSALESGDGPDVIEVGNTQVARYVAGGGVRNLTLEVSDLDGDDWIPGLAEPGKIDGYQFGIPYYAANRVVVYRKDLFAEAGVERLPKTREQWLEATRKLHQPEEGRQGIYLPGQNWYVLAGFIWDEGGNLAIEQSGQWSGALHTKEALRGMAYYQELQALGNGPVGSDEAEPNHAEVFADEEVAQLIAVPGEAEQIVNRNPDLRGKLGFFPVPGKSADEPGAVFTGGSVLILPEKSDEREMGYQFLKLLTSDKWQREIATTMSYVPNRTTLSDVLKGHPGAAAMAKGAENGHATPNSPSWAALESDNPVKRYQTDVLTGADPTAAARKASSEITSLLSARPR